MTVRTAFTRLILFWLFELVFDRGDWFVGEAVKLFTDEVGREAGAEEGAVD